MSDWSSDVCSSDLVDINAESVAIGRLVIGVTGDLLGIDGDEIFPPIRLVAQPVDRIELVIHRHTSVLHPIEQIDQGQGETGRRTARSEERRVGKEWGST